MPTVSRVSPRPRVGIAFVVAGAVLFSINASLSKVVLDAGLGTAHLTLLRSVGTATCLLVALLLIDRRRLRITWREVPLLVCYGVIGIALVQWFYAVAIDRLTVSLALLLEFTAPLLVALWARFVLREPVRARVWLALLLALGGLALVARVWQAGSLDTLGVLAGLAAAASLAAYWLIGEHAVNAGAARDPLSLTFWGFAFSSVGWLALLPGRNLPGDVLGGSTTMGGSLDALTVPVWVLVAGVIVVGTALPFLFEVAALRHISATRVGIIAMLEPVLATLVAWLWLRQELSAPQVLGVAVVITGLVLAQTARRQVDVPERPGTDDLEAHQVAPAVPPVAR